MSRETKLFRLSVLLFLALTALLFAVHGNFVVFSNDEGIILDAAQRMTGGQKPYVDFFAYMSPGSYWIQSIVFDLFGISLRTGRLPVIIDCSLSAALLFWLVGSFGSISAGLIALVLFVVGQMAHPGILLAQHRWDSAAISFASIALCVHGARRGAASSWAGGGALALAAAVCTPSLLLLIPVTCIWLFRQSGLRHRLKPYLAGAALAGLAVAAAMAANGTIAPAIRQMLWLRENYRGVNVMAYGSVIGGYQNFFEGATELDLLIRIMMMSVFVLPAITPITSVLLWGYSLARHKEIDPVFPYLLGCTAVYVISTFPRADLAHLAWVAALPIALSTIWLSKFASVAVARSTGALLLLWSLPWALLYASQYRNSQTVASHVGSLRVLDEPSSLDRLLQVVQPRDTLFIHPYLPIGYFLSQANNPTRFSFLAPGMMTSREEAMVLSELKANPPTWAMLLELTEAEFLRLFPSANPATARFHAIESWLTQNYTPVDPPVSVRGYRLLSRKGSR